VLDDEVNSSNNILKQAYKSACPLWYPKKRYPPWWNIWIFNQSYASKVWHPYKDILKKYKQVLLKAKKDSWIEYCESIDNIKDTARVAIVLAKEHTNPSLLNRPDGSARDTSRYALPGQHHKEK